MAVEHNFHCIFKGKKNNFYKVINWISVYNLTLLLWNLFNMLPLVYTNVRLSHAKIWCIAAFNDQSKYYELLWNTELILCFYWLLAVRYSKGDTVLETRHTCLWFCPNNQREVLVAYDNVISDTWGYIVSYVTALLKYGA